MEDSNEKYTGYQLLLNPTEEQKVLFNKYFGVTRYIYNWGIDTIEEYYEETGKTLTFNSLCDRLTKLKHTEKYNWLNEYNVNSLRIPLRDVLNAYKGFFKGTFNKPVRHYKRYSYQSCAIRYDRLIIYSDRVTISSIGDVNILGDVHPNVIGFSNSSVIDGDKFEGMAYRKYTNPRVIFNGCDYYLSFSLPQDELHLPNSCYKYKCNPEWQSKEYTDVIGIDVGCKESNWFTLSNGKVFKRPSQKKDDEKIKGFQKHYKRQLNALKSRQGIQENETEEEGARTKPLKPTKSMIKTLTKQNKVEKRITNRKKDTARTIGNYLLKKKPKAVVFEDFKIKDWKDNIPSNYPNHVKHSIRRVISESMLYTARQIVVNILEPNDIPVIYADEEYPSTQLCNNCGNRQKMGIRQRVYKCPCCGMVMDRDLNASINLKQYGESKLGLI